MSKQHWISILFVTSMIVWIGVAEAIAPCLMMERHESSPLAPAEEQGASMDDMNMDGDDYHDDRYRTWGGSDQHR